MPRGLAKDVRRILDVVEDRGFEVRRGSKHFKIMSAEGRTLASVSTTPSDRRTLDNLVASLRQRGVIEIDPRKEGQVATILEPEVLTPEQEDLRVRLIDLLKVIPQHEFARHAVELANQQHEVRTFGSNNIDNAIKACQWHLGRLVNHAQPIAKWAAHHLDAAVTDLTAVPEDLPTEPVKDNRIELMLAARNESMRVAEGLGEQIASLAHSFEEGLGIEPRKGYAWGHGVWTLVGRLAENSARRHGIELKFTTRVGTVNQSEDWDKLRQRLRSIANGNTGAYPQTQEVAQLLLDDWEKGYRLTQEMVDSLRDANTLKPIPSELRATAFDEVKAVVPARTTIPPTPEPIEALLDDDDYAVMAEDLARETDTRWVEVPAPVSAVTRWEDGEMPLHLEQLQHTFQMMTTNSDAVARIIETARKVMLTELRSH